MSNQTFIRSTLAAAVILSLSACGGGGGSKAGGGAPTTVTPQQPSVPATNANGLITGTGNANVTLPSISASSNPAPVAKSAIGTAYNGYTVVNNLGSVQSAGITGAGQTIALIDSGADGSLPALAGKIAFAHDYAADITPAQYTDATHADTSGHGSNVAQEMVGQAWGTIGAGIAPGASLVVGRVTSDYTVNGNPVESIGTTAINNAVTDLAARGARLFNLSIGVNDVLDNLDNPTYNQGGPGTYRINEQASYRNSYNAFKAVAAQDSLIVFAAGNAASKSPTVLGGLPTLFQDADLQSHWLVVAAIDPTTGTLASYSAACGVSASYCLSANGSYINGEANTGTAGNPDLYQFTGTSQAAPAVTATAALVRSQYPWMTSVQVAQTILGTATDIGDAGVDATYGYGILNITNAVKGPGRFDWGNFDANVTADATFGNDIHGAGSLTKDGTSTLTLSGNSDYTGGTTVNAGNLVINGSVRSNVTVNAGSAIGGKGIVGANVTVKGGTTVVANGGLSVTGAYSQDAASTLAVYLGSVLKTGSASLAGTLQIAGVNSGYTAHTKETVLYAANGYTGTFASLTSGNGVMTDATVEYTSANYLSVNLTRISVGAATASASSTPANANVAATAANLEPVFVSADKAVGGTSQAATASNSAFLANAAKLEASSSADVLANSVHSLSGESYADTTTLGFQAIDATRNTIATHVASSNDTGFWFAGVQGGATLGDRGYYGATSNISGQIAGFDVKASENWVVGGAVNFADLSTRVDTVSGQNHAHTTGVDLYARFNAGDVYVLAIAGQGKTDYRVSHSVFLGDSTVAENGADYNGRQTFASLEAGWNTVQGKWTIAPAARVSWASIHRDGFQERSVEGFNIVSGSSTTNQLQGSLGGHIAREFEVSDWTVTADVSAWYTHLFAGTNSSFNASYDGAIGSGFRVNGINASANRFEAGAGLSAKRGNFTIFAHYDVGKSSRADSHTVSAGVNWAF
jgi:autotransporter-associated beta strand protein